MLATPLYQDQFSNKTIKCHVSETYYCVISNSTNILQQHNNNKFASLHNYADQFVKVYDVFARTCYAQDDTTINLDEIWHNTQVSTILLVHHHCLGTCEQQIFQNF